MSTPYNRRRRKNRGAAMIIVTFTVIMVLLLALFFTFAMKQTAAAPQGDQTIPTETGGEMTTGYPDIAESPAGTSGMGQNVPVNAVPDDTQDSTVKGGMITPDTTAAVTEAPETTAPSKVTNKTPDIIPVTYNEELLSQVALPEGTAPDGYREKLVFYGDSTTHGMKAYKVFGSRETTQVWTPTSGTLALFRAATDLVYDPNSGTEKSLSDICSDNKPEYLIVTLGVNGVSFMDRDYFKTEYQKLIDIILTASPDTHLILQSIYPVARSYEKQDSINNNKIQAANEWIVELASENSLPYLNTYSALVGEDGYLPETYQNGDGMHFNEQGFAVVMDYVETHPCT